MIIQLLGRVWELWLITKEDFPELHIKAQLLFDIEEIDFLL